MRPLPLVGALLLLAAAPLDAEPRWKNLQLLPQDLARDRLKGIMRAQSRALGVECDYCHDMPDAARDTRRKLAAREMMRLTDEINRRLGQGGAARRRVTCETCHRGKPEPTATERR